jgi:hypothetical protein
MNMKTIAAAILALTLTTSAFTAESAATTMTTTASTWQKLKESPASLSIFASVSTEKDETNKINGASSTNMVYLGWKLSDKDSLRLENRWATEKLWGASTKEARKMDTTFKRTVLKYSRSGILNQKDHGINLKAALEARYYFDHDLRTGGNNYGLLRPSLSASRSLKNGLSLSATLMYAKKLNIETKQQGTGVDYLLLLLSQSYSITDKLTVTLSEDLYHSYVKGRQYNGVNDSSSISIAGELGYQLTTAFSGAVSVSGTPFKGHDQRTSAANWAKELSYGANVYISVF